jgi:LAO/AO transport system kinase
MVDFFLILMIAGAGDELLGIKKGVLEVADAIVINKADGDNILRAQMAQKDYQTALHLLMRFDPVWSPPVLTCSSLEMTGLEGIWQTIADHRAAHTAADLLEAKRREQSLDWMDFLLDEGLRQWFYGNPAIRSQLPGIRTDVAAGKLSPTAAADRLLDYLRKINGTGKKA